MGLSFAAKQRTRPLSQQNGRSMQALQSSAPTAVADLAEGLEAPVQLVYLLTLLGFLVVGAYLVVRQVGSISNPNHPPFPCLVINTKLAASPCCALQVLIRRELEEAARTLGDRVRQKDATCEVRSNVNR